MKQIKVKHKIIDFIISVDDDDFDKVSSMNLRVNISRKNIPFVLDYTDYRIPVVVQRVLLDYPKERINFKDGNKLNLQRSNMELITEEVKRNNRNKYGREHYDSDKAYSRYLKNKEKINECNTKWRHNNKARIRSSRTRIEVRYQRGAYEVKRTGKREIDISYNDYCDIMNNMKCHYCNSCIKLEIGFGLDRIDNSKGYFKDNVVPCCGVCNRTKGDRFNHDEFRVMMNALVKYRSEFAGLCFKNSEEGLIKLENNK